MMTILLTFALLGLTAVSPAYAADEAQEVPCPFEIPQGTSITCYAISLPENYDEPDGRMISLTAAVIHSTSPDPAPDPVLLIDGGPGVIAYLGIDYDVTQFAGILSQRDLIVFNVRGAGYSTPSLDCPELYIADQSDESERLERQLEALRACRARLDAEGFDLAQYNSAANAADIAALREALGYKEWNLLGLSYGTRIALTVLRDHPEGIRSVILDSPVPPHASLLPDGIEGAQDDLTWMFSTCKADLSCNLAYPNLEQEYYETIELLEADPVEIPYTLKDSDEELTLNMDGNTFATMVFSVLQYRSVVANAPAVISNLHDRNPEGWAEILKEIGGVRSLQLSMGVFLSTFCGEEAPFYTDEQIAVVRNAPISAGDQGRANSGILDMCEAFGMGKPAPIENEPVHSDVPVLILSGVMDGRALPRYAGETAANLPNAQVISFPATGHGVLNATGACGAQIAMEYLNDPSAPAGNPCLKDITTPAFLVTITPTRPFANGLGVASGVIGGAALVYLAYGLYMVARRTPIAWNAAFRRVGWIYAAVSAAAVLSMGWLIATGVFDTSTARAVEIALPLILALQTSLLFAPNEEPSLEVLLAGPHPIHWLTFERVLVAVGLHGLVGLVGGLALVGLGAESSLGIAMLRWIAPSLFLSGIAIYITVRGREVALGPLVVFVLWVGMLIAGPNLLPPQLFDQTFGFPINLLQGWVWPVHLYLQPDDLLWSDYVLNRITLIGLGIGLMALAVYYLRDSERILLGSKSMRAEKKAAPKKAEVW